MATPTNGISVKTQFYKYNEFFDVCEINGSKFALFSKSIECNDPLSIDLCEYNVIFLAPIQVEEHLYVKAISVLALTTLNSKKGRNEINASEKFISLGSTTCSYSTNRISGDMGCLFISCITERLEMISNEFKEGISNMHGPTIVNALVQAFSAIDDPSDEKEVTDISEAFDFFKIPSDI